MKVFVYIKKIVFFSFILALATSAFAEIFRIGNCHIAKLAFDSDSNTDKNSILTGINDSICIILPEDMTFVQGIELSIKIPQEVSVWRDSVAFAFYNSIKPEPSEKVIDYEGERIYLNTFPERLGYTILVPLSEKNTIKETPYANKIPVIPSLSDRRIFFRTMLAMKGVDDSLYDAKFEISVKPIFYELGRLTVKAKSPFDGTDPVEQYTVFADEKVFPQGNTALLSSGTHQISLVSKNFRNEIRSVNVEKARNSSIEIELRDIKPTLQISAPEAAQLYFDNEAIENNGKTFVIFPGEHVLKSVISDYETIKTFTAVNGRSYTISFTVDATISESD